MFTRHGLKRNLEKTEVLHIGHQREELDIELEGKKLAQRDSFVYLGGAVCRDGKTEREVRQNQNRFLFRLHVYMLMLQTIYNY